MEPIDLPNLRGYSKQELFALFREFLEEYYKQKEKDLYEVSLIERIIRVEEELKNLRKEMEYLRKEMEYRFEALLREMNSRFEAITKEMNTRFETQKRESDARFEALEKRFNFLQWTMMLGFTILSILITVFSFLFRS
jgi:predicted nuclease with TOPRIM domain